jgi:hypothetical protein
MGSWDCYCAICGGPLGGVQVSGRPRTRGFHRRQALKARRAERIARGESPGSDDEFKDGEDGTADATIQDVGREDDGEGSDSDESMNFDSEEEDYTLDPEIISENQTVWTDEIRVLGVNSGVEGGKK